MEVVINLYIDIVLTLTIYVYWFLKTVFLCVALAIPELAL